jgi:DNA-binding NarL/FixJ family response regulator
MRIAIVDDHMVVRDGIKALVARTDDLELAWEASSFAEALELFATRPVDIALVDYRLGGESGFELCSRLKQRQPSTHIVIFTAFGNPELLTRAIRAGASGYVLKETYTDRLPEILRLVQEHGSYFDGRLASQTLLATLGADPASERAETLTERESRILQLIAQGRSNVEIAHELYLSPHTVKFHVTRLLRRYDVRRRSELAKVAAEMFL